MMMMADVTTLEGAKKLLEAALNVIDTRDTWTQGWFAVDIEGNECRVDSCEARQWCAWGAMKKASIDTGIAENEHSFHEAAVCLADAVAGSPAVPEGDWQEWEEGLFDSKDMVTFMNDLMEVDHCDVWQALSEAIREVERMIEDREED